MSTIKERIRQLRKEKKLTQEELAKLLGLSAKSNIANYESGANAPSDEIKLKMCEIFDCTMDYLMGNSPFKTGFKNYLSLIEKNIATEIFNENKEELLKYNISDKEKDAFINLLMGFSSEKTASEKSLSQFNNEIYSFLNNKTNDKKLYDLFLKCGREYTHLILNCNLFIPGSKAKPADNILGNYPQLDELQYKKLEKIMMKTNDEYFGNSIDKNIITHEEQKLFNIPILGKIAAGKPILADEYLEGYLPIDPNIYGMTTPDDYFYLKVSGESMNLKVQNGDYALIRKQDTAEDGDIIVAIVNSDDEATLKRYKKLNEQFVLLEPMSNDPTIEAITVDLKETKFQIIGKAIGQFGKF